MKNQRILLLCLWLATASLSVRADLVPRGVRSVDACFRLTNMAQYPNYVFVIYSQDRFQDRCTVLKPNDCIRLGRQSYSTIYAIAKSRFREDAIKEGVSDEDRQRLRQYFSSKANAIGSGGISCSPYVYKSESAIAVEDMLRIKSLSPDTLVIVYESATYRYPGGRIRKRAYTNQQERPASSYAPGLVAPEFDNSLWLAIGGVSLAGLLIVIRNRRQ